MRQKKSEQLKQKAMHHCGAEHAAANDLADIADKIVVRLEEEPTEANLYVADALRQLSQICRIQADDVRALFTEVMDLRDKLPPEGKAP